MINRIFISGLALSIALVSCNQSASHSEHAATDSVSVNNAGSPVINDDQTQQVYNDYIKLKDVLVLSDPEQAQKAARKLASSLAKIDGCENTAAMASNIAASQDLAAQRTSFTAVSADIVALMKHTDVASGKLYVQHCPMANNGEGGYWLSSQEEVRNPYYGDEMLNCGSVTETITAQ